MEGEGQRDVFLRLVNAICVVGAAYLVFLSFCTGWGRHRS